MQRYTAVKAEAGADDLALALIVDAELFRVVAPVRWLDSAEVRLGDAPQFPLPERRPSNTLVEAARRSAAQIGARP